MSRIKEPGSHLGLREQWLWGVKEIQQSSVAIEGGVLSMPKIPWDEENWIIHVFPSSLAFHQSFLLGKYTQKPKNKGTWEM